MLLDLSYLEVFKNPRARRLALRLDSSRGIVRLVVPPGISMKKAHEFAALNRDWIENQVGKLPSPVPFCDGQVLPILEKDRTLDIFQDKELRTTKVSMDTHFITVRTPLENPQSRVTRYLKKIFKAEIETLASLKAQTIGKTIRSISLRDTRSRWGSCSSDGNLSFSWRLIFAPFDAIDYVIAHEVAHLKHMDHSKAFWALCCDLSRDSVQGKKWMRTHGHTLYRYGQRP